MRQIYQKTIMMLLAFMLSITISAQAILEDDFSNISSDIPVGWDNSESTCSDDVNWQYFNNFRTPECLRFDSYNSSPGELGILKTPLLNLGHRAAILTFDYKNPAGGAFEVFISTDGGTTYTTSLIGGLTGKNEWTNVELSLLPYANQSNIKIVFHVTSNYGSGDAYVYLDNVKVAYEPLCKQPIDLSVKAVTQTTATLSWDLGNAGATSNKYVLNVVSNEGDKIYDYDTIILAQGITTTTLAGLEASTVYNVQIQSDCQDIDYSGMSEWSDIFSFPTLCAAENLPYSNDFSTETASVPNCWFTGGANAENVILSAEQKVGGADDQSMKIPSTESGDAFMATSQIAHAANDMELSFKIYGPKGAAFVVHLATDIGDMSTAIPTMTETIRTDNTWTEYVISTMGHPYAAMTGLHIVFYNPSGNWNTIYIDDVEVKQKPTCVRPSGDIVVSNITHTSATFAWNAMQDKNSNFQIRFNDGTNIVKEIVTSNPYTHNSLSSSTDYTVDVRQICSEGDTSEWGRAAEFYTVCAPISTFPFLEGFENINNLFSDCWYSRQTEKGSGDGYDKGDNGWIIHQYVGYDSERSAQLQDMSNGTRTLLSLPYMTLPSEGGTHEISFYMYRNNRGKTEEGVKIWVNTEFDTIGGIKMAHIANNRTVAPTEDEQGWYKYDFPIPMGGDVFVMFEGVSENGQETNIDLVKIDVRPSCLKVLEIKQDSVSQKAAHFSWAIEAGSASQWIVNYQLPNAEMMVDTVDVPNYTVEGLISNHEYSHFYLTVKSYCGGEIVSEEKSKRFEFKTLCGDESFPYFEDFEDYFMTRYNCWKEVAKSNVGRNWFPYLYENQVYSSEMAVCKTTAIVTPKFTIDSWAGKRISIDLRGCSDPVRVGLMANQTDTLTFIALGSFKPSDRKLTFNVDIIDEYDERYIAIITSGSSDELRYIDNLKVRNTPLCEDIISLSVDSIRFSSARVKIEDGENSKWEIKYATTPYVEAEATTITTTNKRHVITGLTTDVEYALIARSVCSDTKKGDWTTDTILFTPVCENVEEFSIDSLQVSSAKVNITDGKNLLWEVKYCAVPFVEANAVTVSTSNRQHTITGLEADTRYVLTVRSMCSAEMPSEWSRDSVFFRTLCNPFEITAQNPFFEGFEEGYENYKSIAGCWTQERVSGYEDWKANTEIYYEIAPYEGGLNARLWYNHETYLTYRLDLQTNTNYKFSCFARQDTDNDCQIRVSISKDKTVGHNGTLIIDGKDVVSGEYQEFKSYFIVPSSGVYYLKVGGKIGGDPAYMVMDNIKLEVVACAPPSVNSITTNSITSDSVSLQWVNPSPKYLVKLSTTSIDPATEDGDFSNDTITGNVFNKANLSANTSYFYYIQSICDATSSSPWSDEGVFTTRCSIFDTPYTESFDDGTSDFACWISLGDSDVSLSTDYCLSGSKSMKCSGGIPVASPELNVSSLTDIQLSAWVYTSNDDVTFSIGIMTDLNDITTYEKVSTITVKSKDKWVEILSYFDILNDPDYADWADAKNVVINVPNDYTVYFDNVTFEDKPSCPKVLDVVVTDVTDASASVDWTPNSEQSWNLILRQGETIVKDTVVLALPVVLNGLTSNRPYSVDVRAICAIGDSSVWMSADFKTVCKRSYDLPFYEGFDHLAGDDILDCWVNDQSYSRKWSTYVGSKTPTPSYELSMFDNWGYGYWSVLETPIINLKNQTIASLEFEYMSPVAGFLTVLISTDGGTEFKDTLFHSGEVVPSLSLQIIDLTKYCGSDVVIAFKGKANGGTAGPNYTNDVSMRLDNITVLVTFSCLRPTDLAVDAVFTDYVEMTVTDTTSATAWDIAIVPPGTLHTEITTFTSVNTKSFTIRNLNIGTRYDAFVRANCGSEQSSWVPLKEAFATVCLPQTLPYSQFFEDMDNVEDIPCVDILGAKSNYPSVEFTNIDKCINSGSQALQLVGAKDSLVYFILPELAVSIDTVSMLFYYTNEGISAGYDGELEMGLIPISLDTTDFILLETYSLQPTKQEVFYDFADNTHTGTGYRIAFRFKSGSDNYYVALDDISLSYYSPCIAPESIELTAIDITTADVRIVGDITTNYELAYGPIGSNFEDFTIIPNVTDNDVSITGLQVETRYEVHVRSVCEFSNSRWIAGLEFKTPCAKVPLPYSEGFEVYESIEELPCVDFVNWKAAGYYPSASFSSSYVSSGIQSLRFESSSLKDLYYVLPELDVPIDTVSMSFSYKSDGTSEDYGTLELGLIPTTLDTAGFIILQSYPNNSRDMQDAHYEFLTSGYEGMGYRIALRYGGGKGSNFYMYIDDINLNSRIACFSPSHAELISAAKTIAEIKINDSINQEWEVAYGNADSAFEDLTILSDISNDTVVLPNLISSKRYQVFVRAKCSNNFSAWTEALMFNTVCSPFSLPYNEGFEGFDGVTSVDDILCVDFLNLQANEEYPKVSISTDRRYVNNGIRGLKLENSDNPALYMVLPELSEPIDTVSMSFSYYSPSDWDGFYKLSLGLIPLSMDIDEFIELKVYPYSEETMTDEVYEFVTTGYSGMGYRIAFRIAGGRSDYSSGSAGIDDISLNYRSACVPTHGVEFLEAGLNTAEIKIHDFANDEWEIAWGHADAAFADLTTLNNITDDTVLIDGLISSTPYQVLARATCSEGTSGWTEPIFFPTKCSPYIIDDNTSYIEDFQGYEVGELPICWTSGTGSSIAIDIEDNNVLKLSGWFGQSITLPKFSEPSRRLLLSLDAKYNGSGANGQLYVAYASGIHGEGDIENVYKYDLPINTETRLDIDLTVLPDSAEYIVLRTMDGDIITIDSVVVTLAPTCYTPNVIEVKNIGDVTAKIHYMTAPNHCNTEYAIYSNSSLVETAWTTNMPITFTNLTGNTEYSIVLRSECKDGGLSDTTLWSDEVFFATDPSLAVLPYNNTFEDAVDNSMWMTVNDYGDNQWIISDKDVSAIANGTSSLYISKNASENVYDDTDMSSAWAYRSFKLEEGVYTLSFLHKLGGSSSDYMRAFIAHEDIDLSNASDDTRGLIVADEGSEIYDDTTWTEHKNTIIIEKSGKYNLAFYWFNDSRVGVQPPAAIDSISFYNHSCIEILNPEVLSVGVDTARIALNTMNDSQAEYEVVIRTSNSEALSQTEIDAAINYPGSNDTIVLRGLESDTRYYAYTRVICSENDTSIWSNSFDFLTDCAHDTIDANHSYFEGFESNVHDQIIAGCWYQDVEWTANRTSMEDGRAPLSGDVSATIRWSSGNLMQDVYLFAGTEYTFIVYGRQSTSIGADANLSLGILTTPGDDKTFVQVAGADLINGDYQEVAGTFTPTSEGLYTMVVRNKCGFHNYMTIDDISLYVAMCDRPTGITVSDITDITAQISWNASADSSQLVITGGGLNDTIGVNTNGAAIGTFQLSGLSAITPYNVAITNFCGEHVSLTISKSFTSACGVYDLPYFEDFQSYESGNLPICWDNSAGNVNESDKWQVASDGDNRFMKFNSSLAANESTNTLRLQTFEVDNADYALSFDYMNPRGGAMSVFLSKDGGVTYADTVLDSVVGVFDWTKAIIPIHSYNNENITIIVHSVANNKAGDANHYIDNMRISSYGGEVDIYDTVCAHSPYNEHGYKLTAYQTAIAGIMKIDRLKISTSDEESDTLMVLNLFVNPTRSTTFKATFCEGSLYSGHGFEDLSEERDYIRYLSTGEGCDSTIILYLSKINPNVTIDTVICEGDTIDFNGQEITAAGSYEHTEVATIGGCDSTTTLLVTVTSRYHVFREVICEGGSFTFEGVEYNTTGRHEHTFPNANGCDSIRVLDLWVNPALTEIDSTICHGQFVDFDGENRRETGKYTAKFISQIGDCDSLVILNLVVTPIDTAVVSDFVCEGEEYNGNGFAAITITKDSVLHRLFNDEGCNSVVELNLRLSPTVEIYDTVRITQGDVHVFCNNTYNTSGDYICEDKTEEEGCDSITYLNLIVEIGSSTAEIEARSLSLAPNPIERLAYSIVDRDWTLSEQDGMRMEVLDAVGKVLYSTDVTEFPIVIDNISVSGIYYVRIITGTGEIYIGKLIVK